MPLSKSSVDADTDVDLSWLNTHKRLTDIKQNYFREPMASINLYFVYVNINDYINKITRQTQDFGGSENTVITNDQLLAFAQRHKILDNVKYQLQDILLYNIDIEPENIQDMANTGGYDTFVSSGKRFLTSVPLLGDVKISKSIFIFHELNAIYFIFQEMLPDESKKPKPILKILDDSVKKAGVSNGKKTKRVAIVPHRRTKRVIDN